MHQSLLLLAWGPISIASTVFIQQIYRVIRPPGMKHTFENQPSQRSQDCTNGQRHLWTVEMNYPICGWALVATATGQKHVKMTSNLKKKKVKVPKK
jgi:hypothetical protein